MPPEDLLLKLGKAPIPSTPPEVVVGVPADLLRRRPDVRRAERQAAAQCAQIGVAVAEFYPHFSLVGNLGWSAETFNNLWKQRAFNGTVGPTFQWNILQYGRLLNNYRFQDAKFQELAIAYQSSVLNAQQEAENGLVTFLEGAAAGQGAGRKRAVCGQSPGGGAGQIQARDDQHRPVDSDRAEPGAAGGHVGGGARRDRDGADFSLSRPGRRLADTVGRLRSATRDGGIGAASPGAGKCAGGAEIGTAGARVTKIRFDSSHECMRRESNCSRQEDVLTHFIAAALVASQEQPEQEQRRIRFTE